MSSVGFGEFAPSQYFSAAVSMVQMFLALTYQILIFSIGLVHFRIDQEKLPQTMKLNRHLSPRDEDQVQVSCGPFQGLCNLLTKLQDGFLKYQIVAVPVFNLSNIGFLYLVKDQGAYFGNVVKLSFSIIEVFFLFILFRRLITLYQKQKITAVFVIQSYISIVISFSTIYTTVFLVFGNKDTFVFTSSQVTGNLLQSSSFHPIIYWSVFLFFSLTLQTTTGYGNIFPTFWLTRALVIVHLILSVCYTIIIFSLGLSGFTDRIAAGFEKRPVCVQNVRFKSCI
eukprot:TRINITY_DN19586_c0_g1_i4.p1 TRINITY_DN19586_c0_g1~~TRINITY_DN19586_c0_g1_i4.p1  ORF type:complete len:323 (-),score=84.95 TRINITY_DN19586_c0_g1_i4:313-1158(-)